MKTRLTEKLARQAETPARNTIISDSEVTGFGLRITQAGAKSFVLSYTFDGWKRRYTIGAWPDWSVTAAREEAKRLKREIDLGDDPLSARSARREAPTVSHLIERYIGEHLPKLAERNRSDQISMLRRLVEPQWGKRKVEDITRADVDQLLAEIAKGRARPAKEKTSSPRRTALKDARPTPVRANRAGEMLRKMFNLAVRWDMRADNPAAGFLKNPETPRDRYLSHKEIATLSDVLSAHPNQRMADVIRLILLTGARRGEALNARWDQFDLEAAVWTKPAATTKQRRTHRTPLSAAATALLQRIRSTQPADCVFVFPGDAEGQPLIEIKWFWDDIRKQAELPGVRIHDLRHTFASLLVSGGMTLPMIGHLLGHTQVQTTSRYAHLFDDPLRAGLDQIGDMLRPKLRLVGSGTPQAQTSRD